ncbi:MAG: hypothetical protein R2883_06490 [Caldisericia bacterium]
MTSGELVDPSRIPSSFEDIAKVRIDGLALKHKEILSEAAIIGESFSEEF